MAQQIFLLPASSYQDGPTFIVWSLPSNGYLPVDTELTTGDLVRFLQSVAVLPNGSVQLSFGESQTGTISQADLSVLHLRLRTVGLTLVTVGATTN